MFALLRMAPADNETFVIVNPHRPEAEKVIATAPVAQPLQWIDERTVAYRQRIRNISKGRGVLLDLRAVDTVSGEVRVVLPESLQLRIAEKVLQDAQARGILSADGDS